jgi:hypothetical protein
MLRAKLLSAVFSLLLVLFVQPATTPLFAAETPAPAQDPRAVRIAEQVWQAMGGDEAWQKARFIRFDFGVEVPGKPGRAYHHAWDRYTGRYRVEGTNKDGQALLILFNVNDRTGKAWVDGKPADPEKTKQLLEYGYGRFINDTYWFLMPYKMRDPGVHLAYEGVKTDDAGKKWEVVRLSFDQGIGLTSGDQYHAYIDPATHLMGRWDYELEGEEHDKGSWSWTDWKKIGPLMLCPDKKEIGGETMIRTPISVVSDSVDESAFAEPR